MILIGKSKNYFRLNPEIIFLPTDETSVKWSCGCAIALSAVPDPLRGRRRHCLRKPLASYAERIYTHRSASLDVALCVEVHANESGNFIPLESCNERMHSDTRDCIYLWGFQPTHAHTLHALSRSVGAVLDRFTTTTTAHINQGGPNVRKVQ